MLLWTLWLLKHKTCHNNHEKIKILSKLHQSQSISMHKSGLDHQFWVQKLKTTLLAFNHHKVCDFTLSNNSGIELWRFRNNLSFRSFHKTQTHWSQIKWNKDRWAFKPPAYSIKCTKWSEITLESTLSTSSHARTISHNTPKFGQDKNIWFTSSTCPHPVTQNRASTYIIPRF